MKSLDRKDLLKSADGILGAIRSTLAENKSRSKRRLSESETPNKTIPTDVANISLTGWDMDTNGNKVIRFVIGKSRGFSIQTNGNLPKTHSIASGPKNLQGIPKNDLLTIGNEILKYIESYGTSKQKENLNQMQTEITMVSDELPVLMRKMKQLAPGGDITAILPTVPGNRIPDDFTAFSTRDGHSAASKDWYRMRTVDATPEEYKDTLAAMQKIYAPEYKLKVVDKWLPEYDKIRKQEIDRVENSRPDIGQSGLHPYYK